MGTRESAAHVGSVALRLPLSAVIGALLLAVVVAAGRGNVSAGAADAGNRTAIEQVVLGARQADIGLAVIPRTYRHSQLPESVAVGMKLWADRQCRRYYVGRFLRMCLAIQRIQIDQDVAGRFLVLQGKVTAIQYGDIQIVGRKATASALITEAIGLAQRTHGKLLVTRSHNTIQVTDRLIEIGGTWKVNWFSGQYLPGNEP